ncbi:hypothetical protein FB451DRAFT_1087369 [Mycena latifolia]|nr:hypothetical protein FB451DRAFT_1087369 [Mycena latifolia]
MSTTPTSERFCAPDADIRVLSSDGVLFKVHRKNLEFHSDIFADAASSTRPENGDEIVRLSEASDVLDVLFQYMYRQPQPDLRGLKFDVCARLAEAAEKYVVYSAVPATKLRLRDSITEHPLEVLDYAARHNHADLATEAARLSMGLPVLRAVRALAPDTLMKWAVFYDKWHAKTRGMLEHGVKNMTRSSPPFVAEALGTCIGDSNPCHNYRETMERCFKEGSRKWVLEDYLGTISTIQFGV